MDVRFKPLESRIAMPKGGRLLPKQYNIGWTSILEELDRELRALKATDIVIEADFRPDQIRIDGWPRGGAAPETAGVRLSFRSASAGGERSIAVYRFAEWQQNLRAIGLVLQRLRLVAEIDPEQGTRAYAGYARLPEAAPKRSEFANVAEAMSYLSRISGMPFQSPTQLDWVFRAAARKAHPDTGGSEEAMRRVIAARELVETHMSI